MNAMNKCNAMNPSKLTFQFLIFSIKIEFRFFNLFIFLNLTKKNQNIRKFMRFDIQNMILKFFQQAQFY